MKNKADFELILRDVRCEPYTLALGVDEASLGATTRRCFLQVRAMLADNTVPGANASLQHGRKWFLSPHMTKSEVVLTALKAVLTFEEHETRERFLYRGRAIFDPHYDVDLLWEMRGRPGALDERTDERMPPTHWAPPRKASRTLPLAPLMGELVGDPLKSPGNAQPEPLWGRP